MDESFVPQNFACHYFVLREWALLFFRCSECSRPGFVPSEDQGYVLAAIMLPSSASLQRSTEAMDAIEKALDPVKGIETKNSIGGFSLLDGE